MTDEYTVFDIANWFLHKEEMTPKKLQKMTYYAQAWSNALFNKPLMNTTFEAWRHGPVSHELYNKYKQYGWNNIPRVENLTNEFTNKVIDLLESVWITYGDKNGDELEALTHQELPWITARMGLQPEDSSNIPISDEVMRKFYLSIYAGD